MDYGESGQLLGSRTCSESIVFCNFQLIFGIFPANSSRKKIATMIVGAVAPTLRLFFYPLNSVPSPK